MFVASEICLPAYTRVFTVFDHAILNYHTDNITCLSNKFETPQQPYSQ